MSLKCTIELYRLKTVGTSERKASFNFLSLSSCQSLYLSTLGITKWWQLAEESVISDRLSVIRKLRFHKSELSAKEAL